MRSLECFNFKFIKNESMFCVSCSVYHILCIMFCVSCSVYHVLCIMFCVSCSVYHILCIMFCVSCSVYHVLCIMFCVSYSLYHVRIISFILSLRPMTPLRKPYPLHRHNGKFNEIKIPSNIPVVN